jgi:hypothetical protein
VSVPARTASPSPARAVPARPRGSTPAPRPRRPSNPPRRITTGAAPRRQVGFVVLVSGVVGSLLIGVVSLNVLAAQVSFHVDAAERRVAELASERVDLVRREATLSAPGRIGGWAARHGMRLPDDIRSLHAPSGPPDPAGAAAPGTAP